MNYSAHIIWKKKDGESFIDKTYSRAHIWIFDGGIELHASSSPHVVPLPMSDESAVDPEEAFIAALSSCHLLSFLYVAAIKGYVVESYEDSAEGILAKNSDGKLAMTEVALKPKVIFIGNKIPSAQELHELHRSAHEECFIASSVKSEITIISF